MVAASNSITIPTPTPPTALDSFPSLLVPIRPPRQEAELSIRLCSTPYPKPSTVFSIEPAAVSPIRAGSCTRGPGSCHLHYITARGPSHLAEPGVLHPLAQSARCLEGEA